MRRLYEFPSKDVEIIVDIDNGEISVGKKRQRLLEKSKGRYVVFVDDDDLISPKYVPNILTAIDANPDVVGITGQITTDGMFPKKFIHSLKYREWSEDQCAYYRNPNHLNPVKREFALQTGFIDLNCGEDRDYSKRLLPMLKTEIFIPDIIYFYLFSKKNTATQKHLR